MKTQPLRERVGPLILRALAAITTVILLTVALRALRDFLSVQNVAFIYLLPVFLCTIFWGLTSGLVAGVASFLTFNYFFLQPYYTFQVHATQDLISLLMFLGVAIVISNLLGQARNGLRLAQSREWEATQMYAFSSKLAGVTDPIDAGLEIAKLVHQIIGCYSVEVVLPGTPVIRWPEELQKTQQTSDTTSLTIPMRTTRGIEGELTLQHHHDRLTATQERLMTTFAEQGALALERLRLGQDAQKALLLEESDQMKSSLLNSVSHELRTPLAAIKASVSSLRSGIVSQDPAARDELLATIEEETDDLNILVGNLLDMTRIESGALKPQRRWNSIAEIAQGVVARMHKQLKGFQVELSFPEDLPLVPTDYVLLEQVFTNLISNSAKYAPAESTICIRAAQQDDYIHVYVQNQGPHVPEQHLERIFEKFHRVTENDRITGTGLGLSICKGIIEAHHGRIWAENQSGWFVFHFKLPLTLDGSLPLTLPDSQNE